MITSRGEAEAVARTRAQEVREHKEAWASGRQTREVILGAWAVLGGAISHRFIGPRLYLVWHYGWARVRDEGLSVVRWESLRKTLVVSNGERLRLWSGERELVALPGWLVLMALTAPLVWLACRPLLRKTKDGDEDAARRAAQLPGVRGR